jgi:aspartate racemase
MTDKMENLVGVIGGMGPMATQLFYKLVTEKTKASCDQEHIKMMIYSDTEIPDRTKAILEKNYQEVYNHILEDGKLLEDCGCKAIAITCNTAHFFADMIKDQLDIPIIHMIRETVKVLNNRECVKKGGKIAILGTDGTIKTEIYHKPLKEAGLIPYNPDVDIQKEVMHQIYGRIKKGLTWDEASWQKIEEAIKTAGCDCAIMACTELSVLKHENKLGDFYIDPMEVLAEKVIAFSGKKL